MRKRLSYRLIGLMIVGLAMAAVPAVAVSPDTDDKSTETRRVAGDLDIIVEKRGFSYFAAGASITTPLPEGYPEPTPPGAIEIKHYPSVRRAQIAVDGVVDPDRGQTASFWPLFRHIQANGIAMTAPVEMEYEGLQPDGKGDLRQWTMSFLYRTRDLHPTGKDKADESVVIVDTEPIIVLSSGYLGDYSLLRVRAELFRLDKWLEGQEEWEVAGPPRSFGYNDPSVARSRRWGEVQIPIRSVVPESSDEARPSESKESDSTPAEPNA